MFRTRGDTGAPFPDRPGGPSASRFCRQRVPARFVVSTFAEDLRARLATLILDPAPSESAARLRMTEAASKIVEKQLDSYEDAKANVDKMVDTPEEVVRISKACGGILMSHGRL